MENIRCGLAWRGMGSTMWHCTRHTTWRWQPQLNPYRLGRRLERGPCLPLLAIRTKVNSMQLVEQNRYVPETIHYWHLECGITESSSKSWRSNTRNEEILIEHPWTLWSTLEKLWRNIYPRRPQALLQWPWRQTWAWSWIPHLQRHYECHHGMPTSLQPTHYHSSEGITV